MARILGVMAPLSPKERAILLTRSGLSNDAISGILGIDRDDVHHLMTQDDPQVTFPAVARRTLSHDEILTLNDDPISIIPDPGSGKGVVPVWCVLVFDSTVGYDDAGTLEIDGDLALLSGGTDILSHADFRIVTHGLNQVPGGSDLSAWDNQDPPTGGLNFDLRDSSAISGGHPSNTLTAIVGYLIADIPS